MITFQHTGAMSDSDFLGGHSQADAHREQSPNIACFCAENVGIRMSTFWDGPRIKPVYFSLF